ncbi:MAG: imidazole glycerol phosphate synthase cyclase subunit [Thalassobium sp.]|nr:MAG: imidazole glycerol phosphate synthase cyclase subunit [Thalassobium sp.]
MLKKRLIFTLLYKNGSFLLSRNFRLQRVGDIQWLFKNYHFETISDAIDELIVLNLDDDETKIPGFLNTLEEMVGHCMIPVAAGGQIRSVEMASALLAHGADKLVVNTACFEQPELVEELVSRYGSQCMVASIDWTGPDNLKVFSHSAAQEQGLLHDHLKRLEGLNVGEIYLNAIHRDGTGQGYDFDALNAVPNDWKVPIIMAGGAGHSSHLSQALEHPLIDAAATANLFNFVGKGLASARRELLQCEAPLAKFDD